MPFENADNFSCIVSISVILSLTRFADIPVSLRRWLYFSVDSSVSSEISPALASSRSSCLVSSAVSFHDLLKERSFASSIAFFSSFMAFWNSSKVMPSVLLMV